MCSRADDEDLSPVVMAYQSQWQQRMMMLYGTDMCVVDSTYKTTVYDLPLFVLCIMTNAGYMTVASLLLTDERKESIAARLRQVADWNPSRQPRHFMTDFHEAQISAITSVFPGT